MKRLTALLAAIALAFSLAGCSDPAANPSEGTTPPEASTPLESAPQIDEADDTILRIAGIPASTTLLTVDGAPVSAELYLYWMLYSASSYDNYMQYYGQTLNWDEDVDGMTLSDYLKDDARDAVKFYALLSQRATALGCVLTDAQRTQLAADRQDMVAELGGEEAFAFNLRYAGISEASLSVLNSTSYLYQNLSDYFFGGENAPTATDLNQFIDEQGLLWAKHILLSTRDASDAALPEADIAAVKAQAEDLLAQLLAADESDRAALFDDLMFQNSQDPGLAGAPDGYMFGPGEMVAPFEDATAALAHGQIAAQLVESDFGYHIIMRLEPRLDDALLSKYTERGLDALTSQWLSEAVVEEMPEFAAINPQAVYEAMKAFRLELEVEYNAANEAPEETPVG